MDEFVIRLRPKHIERLIFVAIIIILFGVIFWQSTTLSTNTIEEATTSTPAETKLVDQTDTKVTKPDVKEEITSVVDDTVVEPEVVEPDVEETVETTTDSVVEDTAVKALSGKRLFTLTDVKTTIIEDDDQAKLDSFKLKVENGLAGVYITFKVYIYNVGDTVADFPDQTITLPKIEEGEIYEAVQSWGGERFREIENEKKLLVVFEDSTGKELDQIITSFKAS